MLDALLTQLETEEEKALIEKLYYKYESQMYSTAFSILQHKQDSEDAVQSAFLKIIDYLPKLNLDLNLQTQSLLIVITRNTALNKMKKRKQQLKYEIDIEDYENIPFIEDFDKLGYKDIQNMVDSLPDDLKNVIVLRYILDYSSKTIAEILDITESAVYKRITAARKLLKSTMEECYE